MGEMQITEVQQELLEGGARALENVQEQNRVALTAILAGDNVRVANNVRQEGDMLYWDDPEDGDDDGGSEVEKQMDDAAAKMTKAAKAEGDPSEQTGPALHEGDSEGPEASVPDEEVRASEESEPTENLEPATVT